MATVPKAASDAEELAIVLWSHGHRMLAAGIAFADWEACRQAAPARWTDRHRYWTERAAA